MTGAISLKGEIGDRYGKPNLRWRPVAMEELIGVFLRVRQALCLPDNDFSWSSWKSADDALREIDEVIAKLRAGTLPDLLQMEVFFAATGPIQEVSLSSGWAQIFLKLSDDFDAALIRALS